ncbi:unnamed protein product, partial [marine sediment metagenome]
STAGKIVLDVLASIQARGSLTVLQPTFSATVDSKGYPWPSYLSMDINPGETLYGLLERMVALGHEWNIVPANFDEGGESGFRLNIYTARALQPAGGLGDDHTLVADGPVIMPSDATVGGRLVQAVNMPNKIYVLGGDGRWSSATQEPFEGVDGYKAAFGQIEEMITAGTGLGQETLAQYAGARLNDLKAQENAVQLDMQRSSTLRPFLHFRVGDSINVDVPPYFTDQPSQRVSAISADLKGEGADVTFVVDFGRVITEGEAL